MTTILSILLFFSRKRKVAKESSSLFIRRCSPLVKCDRFSDLYASDYRRHRYELLHGARIALRSIFSVQKATEYPVLVNRFYISEK